MNSIDLIKSVYYCVLTLLYNLAYEVNPDKLKPV